MSAKEYRKAKNPIDGALGVNGSVHKHAGQVSKVELVVKKETFWVRLFLFADMGFAEAFMLGEVECADLTSFFQVSSSRVRELRNWRIYLIVDS